MTSPSKSFRLLPNLSLPSSSDSPASPRTRSKSLSIARSPLQPQVLETHFSEYEQSQPTPSKIKGIQNTKSNAKSPHRRGLSLHTLGTVVSEDDLPSLKTSGADGRDADRIGLLPGRKDSDEVDTEESGGGNGFVFDRLDREDIGEGDDDEEEDIHCPTVSRMGSSRYEGPFQAPDHKEMLGVILSFSFVSLLAIAAGLTTIYDWVL